MNRLKDFKLIIIAFFIAFFIFILTLMFKKEKSEVQIAVPTPTIPAETIPDTENPDHDQSDEGELIDKFNTSPRVPYEYTLSNGEKVTIEIPIGVDPPPQSVVERMEEIEKNKN